MQETGRGFANAASCMTKRRSILVRHQESICGTSGAAIFDPCRKWILKRVRLFPRRCGSLSSTFSLWILRSGPLEFCCDAFCPFRFAAVVSRICSAKLVALLFRSPSLCVFFFCSFPAHRICCVVRAACWSSTRDYPIDFLICNFAQNLVLRALSLDSRRLIFLRPRFHSG